MVETISLTSLITLDIPSTCLTAIEVDFWMPSILSLISWVASAVCLASSLISFATTAKPLPASPALAASMVALRARRFVCSEISVIVSVTLLISWAALPSSSIFVDASSACFTASW
jgi:hypothetical protein